MSFQLPSWGRGRSWEREEVLIEGPSPCQGEGALASHRHGTALPAVMGYLPALPSHQGPRVVPWGLPYPAREKDRG